MSRPPPSRTEIFLVALRLGCTSFGGPVAHLAYFRHEYVVKRGWLDEAQFADLVGLCQFLPGPASSQTGFGVGFLQRGWTGGLCAWLGFTLPSAVLMTAIALGIAQLGDVTGAGWLHGVKAAAVAVVAQAVWMMGRQFCPDAPRRLLALAVAALLLWWPFAAMQLVVIVAGAALGWFAAFENRSIAAAPAITAAPAAPSNPASFARAGLICLALFAVLLAGLPLLATLSENLPLQIAQRFYRAGALVFGGGHVVLPLLEQTVVAPGLIKQDEFLAGYGAAQAMPGPLFTFSAYLGTMISKGSVLVRCLGGVLALVALFLPGLLLVGGALPWWERWRGSPRARSALSGTNAAVVGLLLAALIVPVGTAGVTNGFTAAVAVVALALLATNRVPAWAVVLAAAAAGAVAG